MVVTVAGKAIGAANSAPPIAPKVNPIVLIFLKNFGVGDLILFVISSIFVIGYSLLVVRCWLLVVGYWLLAFGCQLSALRCRL
jgi:hypothetical protein